MKTMETDIAVAGSGPGGMAAAVSAAKLGAKVLLVDRMGYLGGCLGLGLPLLAYLDTQGRQVAGGFAQDLIDRLAEIGGTWGHRRCPMHNSTTIIDPNKTKIICFRMVEELGIEVLLHTEVIEAKVSNGALQSITAAGKGDKIAIKAKVFIDATGDGDMAYLAGARYEKGQYETGEMQSPTLMFDLGGVELEKLFDYLDQHPEDFNYCDTMEVKPGYNTGHLRGSENHVFIGMRGTVDRLKREGKCPIKRDTIIYINQMTPGHVLINAIRILDFDGSNVFDLSKGEIESHLTILPLIKMFKENIPGFEKCYLSSINPVIGVRESRRIAGKKVLRAENIIAGEKPGDSICLGSFKIDIHAGSTDSTIFKYLEEPYGIPYGCTIARDISRLMMAGRCISVDPVVFGSIRIMPTCMNIGQGAGTGAALAIKHNIDPADVDIKELRKVLLDNRVILDV
jgi:ribulose 1,5-bisphosphate synthetase/thiazole synthase